MNKEELQAKLANIRNELSNFNLKHNEFPTAADVLYAYGINLPYGNDEVLEWIDSLMSDRSAQYWGTGEWRRFSNTEYHYKRVLGIIADLEGDGHLK